MSLAIRFVRILLKACIVTAWTDDFVTLTRSFMLGFSLNWSGVDFRCSNKYYGQLFWRLNVMSIWLVQVLNMTRRWAYVCWKVTWKWVNRSNANVVSFDENMSFSSTLKNLYEQNEQFLMDDTAIENRSNIATIIAYCKFPYNLEASIPEASWNIVFRLF